MAFSLEVNWSGDPLKFSCFHSSRFCVILGLMETQLEMKLGGEGQRGLHLLAFDRYFSLLQLSKNPMTRSESIQITGP